MQEKNREKEYFSEKMRKRAGWAVLLAGIIMMLFGIMRGETATVFLKAVNICLECIGIG